MGLFKNDLEKFYELLTKTNKDNNVDFGLIGGKKLIVFGSIDDLDYPDEYMFSNGKVYYLEKPIGFYEETEKVDLTDGEIDIEDLEDDDIYEDELDDVEVETKERKHIFRNGLYSIGNGIGGFFGHFGKRKNIEVEDTEVEEEKEDITSFEDLMRELSVLYSVYTNDNGKNFISIYNIEDLTSDQIKEKCDILEEKFNELSEKYPELKEEIEKRTGDGLKQAIFIHSPVTTDPEWNNKYIYTEYIYQLIASYHHMMGVINKKEATVVEEETTTSTKAKKERKHIFRNGLYAIGNGIGGFFGHFGKRKNIEVEDTEVEEETKTEPKKVEKPKKTKKERKHIFRNGLYAIGNGIGGFFGHFGKRKNIEVEDTEIEEDKKAKVVSKKDEPKEDKKEIAKKELEKIVSLINSAKSKKDYISEHDTEKRYDMDRYDKDIKDCVVRSNEAFGDYAKLGRIDEDFVNCLINDLKGINESLSYKVNEIKKEKDKKIEEAENNLGKPVIETKTKSSDVESDEEKIEKVNKMIDRIDLVQSKLEEKADSNPDLAEKMYNEVNKITKEVFNVEEIDEKTLEEIHKNKSVEEIMDLLNKYIKGLEELYNNLEVKEELVVEKEETKAVVEEEETKAVVEEEKVTLPIVVKEEIKFNSIQDTKAKFDEFDKPEIELKEIEEKIAYYEEFLNTHDLSHADDQDMKERMEQKLTALKERYNDLSKDETAENNLRTEKMSFYTQTSKGIDKSIERIEKERQLRILQAELEGKTVINLGLAEERKIDAKKAELLRLKKECLERKAKVNKYYEEQAARMTAALKR